MIQTNQRHNIPKKIEVHKSPLTSHHVVSELDMNINDGVLQVECDLVQNKGVGLGYPQLGDSGLNVGLDGHGEVRQAGV